MAHFGLFVYTVYAVVLAELIAIEKSQAEKCQVSNREFMKVMETYDRGKPPNVDHRVLKVGVNVYMRELSLHPETLNMDVDLVLQQTWLDRRLSSLTERSPPATTTTSSSSRTNQDPLQLETRSRKNQDRLYTDRLEEGSWHCLWSPDSYIANARSIRTPEIPHPQRLMRLQYGGNLLYSTRLQATVSCPALASHLKKFICSIYIEPYGYSSDVIRLQWNANSFFVHRELTVPQYTLKEIRTTDCMHNSTTGSPSCLVAHLHFGSDLYFFASEIYGSSLLLVLISWTGFWLDGSRMFATRLGLGLGVAALLVLQGIGYRLINQKVGVPANVEVWLAFCLFLVLASLLELALAHVLLNSVPNKLAQVWYNDNGQGPGSNDHSRTTDVDGVVELEDKSLTDLRDVSVRNRRRNRRFVDSEAVEKTARILDIACGLVFPIVFVIFNIIYWSVYH